MSVLSFGQKDQAHISHYKTCSVSCVSINTKIQGNCANRNQTDPFCPPLHCNSIIDKYSSGAISMIIKESVSGSTFIGWVRVLCFFSSNAARHLKSTEQSTNPDLNKPPAQQCAHYLTLFHPTHHTQHITFGSDDYSLACQLHHSTMPFLTYPSKFVHLSAPLNLPKACTYLPPIYATENRKTRGLRARQNELRCCFESQNRAVGDNGWTWFYVICV